MAPTRTKVAALTVAVAAFMVVPVSAAGATDENTDAVDAGDPVATALDRLRDDPAGVGVTSADLADLVVVSSYRSAHNGVTHVNVNQRHKSLEVFGAYATVNIASDGTVVFVGGSLVDGLAAGASGSSDIAATEAVVAAAEALDLDEPEELRLLRRRAGAARETLVTSGGISDAPIPARLGWQPTGDGLRLAWQLVIDDSTGSQLWNVTVDAESGEVLAVDDWTSEDSLSGLTSRLARPNGPQRTSLGQGSVLSSPDPVDDGSSYRVFALPAESPNDGPRTLVTNPADAAASPFGWHDTDGNPGAERTVTRGNNVHAYTDRDATNIPDPDSAADGGAGLSFDFPADLDEHAQNYADAGVTNLFYWNNIVHDVMYRYGFDEDAGNFQVNNYGRGGAGGDVVRAEAADGDGINNANFATPAVDGTGVPRMQMFVWPGNQFGSQNQVVVDGLGAFDARWSRFSPAPTTVGVSGSAISYAGTGCEAELYPEPLPAADWVVIVDGGTVACSYPQRVQVAESLGASAVIVAHDTAADPPILTGPMTDPPVSIPAVSISQADGETIKAAVEAGPTTGDVRKHPDHPGIRAGDLEAGIIIHEYAHGVSLRLTGGPGVNCLIGQEQAGEGWSDYLAIAMLLDPALDDPEGPRGLGPYALFQGSRQADGIRSAPYSRNMAIQPFTYDSIKSAGWLDGTSLALPHGVGHGWAAVLWDLTWDLIDKHGFNPDVYGPWHSGGNNRALQYVIDGLKFQGCSPGLVVARDAIIAAADVLSDGEDTCTIWAAFARRGLGYSAVQGSSASRQDNAEAFDTHPDCRTGFSGGVSDPPTLNVVKSGATVPLVFTLGADQGLDIFAANSPYSRQVDCATRRTVNPAATFITPRPLPVAAQTPGNATLSYDADEDRYTYPWQTRKEWAGTCRELVLTRTDGTQHRAYFQFTPTEPPTEPPVTQLWEARYNGSGNSDVARAVGVDPDGARVFVTGESLGEGSGRAAIDYGTVAYEATTGEELWVARYNGPGNGSDVGRAVEVSPDGARVFVTGQSPGEGTSNDYATIAYDAATGEELWVARYNGPADGAEVPWSLGVSPDGARVFLTGQSQGEGTSNDYATVAYDAATGDELWVARYDGPASSVEFARALAVSQDGARVFVTGRSPGEGTGNDYATVAYDAATGDELWVARYNGPANRSDFAAALDVAPDGTRVFVTGESTALSTGADYATVAYDAATGGELWVARYNGTGNVTDAAQGVAVSPDGGQVFVTGQSIGDGPVIPWDYATVAYDAADGSERWVARYDGPISSADIAGAVGVSPDGSRVFVTGQSLGVGTVDDYATVAYDAAGGDELWVARYNGPANGADVPEALSVSPDGSRVFVTGRSAGGETGPDYATVAYEQRSGSEPARPRTRPR